MSVFSSGFLPVYHEISRADGVKNHAQYQLPVFGCKSKNVLNRPCHQFFGSVGGVSQSMRLVSLIPVASASDELLNVSWLLRPIFCTVRQIFIISSSSPSNRQFPHDFTVGILRQLLIWAFSWAPKTGQHLRFFTMLKDILGRETVGLACRVQLPVEVVAFTFS